MKRFEKQTKTIERNELVETKCDLCGKIAPDKGVTSVWGKCYGDDNDTTVECNIGSSCPDGGERTTYSVDMCPGCFLQKLVPWLESQGATVNTEHVDF